MSTSSDVSLVSQMRDECDAMVRYAFSSGIKVSTALIDQLDVVKSSDSEETQSLIPLASLHNMVTRLVSPATPRTILLLEKNRHNQSWCSFLSPIPIARKLMLFCLVFLVGWIAISLHPDVDGKLNWADSNGFRLFLEEMFVLFAAALGACFAILFQINRFVVRGIYDPKYDSTYWSRLVLGIVAGMILAFLIPLDTTSALKELTKPTLALLGGFSVTVVHRILQRMVAAVEALVQGDTRDIIEARASAIKSEADSSRTEEMMQLSSRLAALKSQITKDSNPETLRKGLDAILGQIVPLNDWKESDSKPK